MSRVRNIIRSAVRRKRRVPTHSKQSSQPFFDFGSEHSFFPGNTRETKLRRQGESGEKEAKHSKLQRATGKKLLSHELTHVVQQDCSIKRAEIEQHDEEKLQKKEVISKNINTSAVSQGMKIQHQQDLMPNVSQGNYDSCGAASIVAAIMIHDKQLSSGVPNNSGFVAAANIVLSYYSMNQNSVISGLVENRRLQREQAEKLYWDLRDTLLRIREESRVPGVTISEGDYQFLSAAIYALYVSVIGGLSQAAIGNITRMLGISMSSEGGLTSYNDIMLNVSLRGLTPGQMAQIGWYVRTGGKNVNMHAFLIGRLNSGTWYLYDQGPSTPVRFTASTLAELDVTIRAAAASGSYWLFTGSTSDFSMLLIGGWTGINILGNASAVLGTSTDLLTSGTRLAEIDAGVSTWGSDVNVVAFNSEYYNLTDAKTAASGLSGKGGAIIEMPKGRFLLYTTTLVSNANRTQTAIDAHEGGEFTVQRFFHAWLQLHCSIGTGSFFKVY